MKVSEQMIRIKSGADLSTHTLLARIAAAIQKRIKDDTGMQVSLVGKTTTGKGKMAATITGQIVDDDTKLEEVQKRVANMMANLKNPANLIELIKKG